MSGQATNVYSIVCSLYKMTEHLGDYFVDKFVKYSSAQCVLLLIL